MTDDSAGGRQPPLLPADQKALENDRKDMIGDFGGRPTLAVVPLDRPVERPKNEHPDGRQVEILSKLAACNRFAKERRPESSVLSLLLKMTLADFFWHLSENSQVRRRIAALGKDRLQMLRHRGSYLLDGICF